MDQITLAIMTRELCQQLYQGWENDPAIYLDMGSFAPYRYDKEAVDRYFDAKQTPDRVLFAILKDGVPVGELHLKRIDRRKKECTLSVHLQNDGVKGRGYGTQAERLALRYAFNVLCMEVVNADTVRKNTRSQHILEKLGFQNIRDEGISGDQKERRGLRPRRSAVSITPP